MPSWMLNLLNVIPHYNGAREKKPFLATGSDISTCANPCIRTASPKCLLLKFNLVLNMKPNLLVFIENFMRFTLFERYLQMCISLSSRCICVRLTNVELIMTENCLYLSAAICLFLGSLIRCTAILKGGSRKVRILVRSIAMN